MINQLESTWIMKKKIVINWKMNGTMKMIDHFCSAINDAKINSLDSLVFCPPFPYLNQAKHYLNNIGSQNCTMFGSFTGEVSPEMLKDVGCTHIILGHAERRKYFFESDSCVLEKLKGCSKIGLTPIICIDDFSQIPKTEEKIWIAYEPIWAIGTGKAISIQDIETIFNKFKNKHPNIPFLYGGSVNSDNVFEFLQIVDGLLIGKAGLDPDFVIDVLKKL